MDRSTGRLFFSGALSPFGLAALCLGLAACAPRAATIQPRASDSLRTWRHTEPYTRSTLGTGLTGQPAPRPSSTSPQPSAPAQNSPAPQPGSGQNPLNTELFPPRVGQVWRLTIDGTGVWRLRWLEADSLGTVTGNASTANKVTRASAATLPSGVRRILVADNPLTFACDFPAGALRVSGGDTLIGGKAFESRDGQLVALERACNAKLTPDP